MFGQLIQLVLSLVCMKLTTASHIDTAMLQQHNNSKAKNSINTEIISNIYLQCLKLTVCRTHMTCEDITCSLQQLTSTSKYLR